MKREASGKLPAGWEAPKATKMGKGESQPEMSRSVNRKGSTKKKK